MQNFTELYEVERRYEELAHKMSTPDAVADAEAYAQMMRDYKELTPVIEEYRRYTDLQTRTMRRTLSLRSVPVQAARRPPCLPTACGVCTRCTLPDAAGSAAPSAPTRQSSAA